MGHLTSHTIDHLWLRGGAKLASHALSRLIYGGHTGREVAHSSPRMITQRQPGVHNMNNNDMAKGR